MADHEAETRSGEPQRDERSPEGIIEIIGATGAVFVVVLGLACVFVVTLVSLGTLPGNQKAAVVTAAFTVIGTIVGAYFGVKVGAAGKEQAEAARHAAAVKVEELAARSDPGTVEQALDKAQERLAAEESRGGAPPRTVL
jgi:heme/copper-type cytochrome/quinol oxidase subunit 2